MRIVVALGGNALLQRGQAPDSQTQQDNVRAAVASIAPLAARHELVVTHGNGPQVGILAAESEQDTSLSHPYPLDVLGAETEGMVGYWLQRELTNALPGRRVVTLLTQTLVQHDDPAFADPQKFIGQVYDEDSARRIAAERGWVVKPDGRYWRRVVPSPRPIGIVELTSIRALLGIGTVVICAGGGGVPVINTGAGLQGVEAVVDKDRAAALLAHQLDAGALLMLTDVPAVQVDFGTPQARPLSQVTSETLRALSFPAGSMGPKVDAACDFVDAGGSFAAIGSLLDAAALADRTTGTVVTRARVSDARRLVATPGGGTDD
ncbi:MAG TPA: carbamate kinase [Mycobacteriales bacterium]|nr:carbamate kinase [Mycobacteriales bacterium]